MTTKKLSAGAIGIKSHGAYIPRRRLQRAAIANAVAWAAPGAKAMAKGERSVANWDEDSITMAVEAARDCLRGYDRASIKSVQLASTTLPFADRSNSGVVIDALNLASDIASQDHTGSRRAATSAMINAFSSGQTDCDTLLLATDCRETKPGSPEEMLYGHGAAGLLLGRDKPIAIPIASASIHCDLVDLYRCANKTDYDYVLEERWVREQGYLKIIPEAVNKAFAKCKITADSIDYFILPATPAISKAVVSTLQLNNVELVDGLRNELGNCGVAQAMLMLSAVLDKAKPNQHILLTGFGQGADAIIFKTTDAISKNNSNRGTVVALENACRDENYIRFLVSRQQLAFDYGKRAERDNRTAQPAFFRNRHAITGFVGGRCQSCNTLQFPASQICVKCGETASQQAESMSEQTGTVKTFTEDWLAYTPLPPMIYGNITFADGASVMMEFSDFAPNQLQIGDQVRMAFRIKDVDERRHFHRYFWKPVPIIGGGENNG